MIDRSAIPAEWQARPQFVAWRWAERLNGKGDTVRTKEPINPQTGKLASSTDPATWGTLAQALKRAGSDCLDGIGYVLTRADGYVAFDLDHCLGGDGRISKPTVRDIVRRLDSWTYITPSGSGLRVVVRAAWPDVKDGRQKGDIQVYSGKRFIVLTDDLWGGTQPVIAERDAEVAAIYTELWPAPAPKKPIPMLDTHDGPPGAYSDDDVTYMLSRFPKAGPKFRDLMAGIWEPYYVSQSEADSGLAGLLRVVTDDDAQIWRIMQGSALYRDKWEREDYRRSLLDFGRYHTARYTPPPPRFARPERPAYALPDPEGHDGLTLADPIDIAALQAELVAKTAHIAELLAYIEQVEAQRDAAWQELNWKARAAANNGVKEEKLTLMAAIDLAREKQERGDVDSRGRVPVANWEVAERVGLEPKTVGRHLKTGADMAIFGRETETHFGEYVDHETGEIKGTPNAIRTESYLVVDDPIAAYKRLARADRKELTGKEAHGGKHDQRPAICTEHPEADVIVIGHATCAADGCGVVVAPSCRLTIGRNGVRPARRRLLTHDGPPYPLTVVKRASNAHHYADAENQPVAVAGGGAA